MGKSQYHSEIGVDPRPQPPFDAMSIANDRCAADGCENWVARRMPWLYCSDRCAARQRKRRQRARKASVENSEKIKKKLR